LKRLSRHFIPTLPTSDGACGGPNSSKLKPQTPEEEEKKKKKNTLEGSDEEDRSFVVSFFGGAID
jgi:hypothetical protein